MSPRLTSAEAHPELPRYEEADTDGNGKISFAEFASISCSGRWAFFGDGGLES